MENISVSEMRKLPENTTLSEFISILQDIEADGNGDKVVVCCGDEPICLYTFDENICIDTDDDLIDELFDDEDDF